MRNSRPPTDWNRTGVVLLDIEGTTTPIDFVYQTLFPYARRNVEAFLRAHFAEEDVAAILDELQAQNAVEVGAGLQPPAWNRESIESSLQSCVAYVKWLIERDSKCRVLKSLQGKIWEQGFSRGELRGEVYADVPRAFERWHRQGREICIYSSGSVLAQQQLFRTALPEDLTVYICNYFDTEVGVKMAAESYGRIARRLQLAPQEILYISDAEKEVEAAREAGMQCVLCERSTQNMTQAKPGSITSFDDVLPN
jgi:enolase-phosphatase E1